MDAGQVTQDEEEDLTPVGCPECDFEIDLPTDVLDSIICLCPHCKVELEEIED